MCKSKSFQPPLPINNEGDDQLLQIMNISFWHNFKKYSRIILQSFNFIIFVFYINSWLDLSIQTWSYSPNYNSFHCKKICHFIGSLALYLRNSNKNIQLTNKNCLLCKCCRIKIVGGHSWSLPSFISRAWSANLSCLVS